MNFLADENVDRPIVQRLRDDGHSVLAVAEMAPGISDDIVLAAANREQAVLLTADKDFGELVFRQRRLFAGIVLIRLAGQAPDEKAALVGTIVNSHGKEMLGAFTVITPRAVRIRRTVPLTW